MKTRRAFLGFLLLLSALLLSPRLHADPQLPVLAPTPFMGWNTWYTFGAAFDEAAIVSTVDHMVQSGLKDAGYTIVWLDAGWWQGGRDASGNITVSPTQWPHGMAYLAQYIHNAGLKAGIYTDAGHGGCAGFGQGSAGHYQQDMNTFAAWGYDAVKVDWCGASSDGLDPKPTFAAIRDALLANSSGRQMLLHLCSWQLDNDSWEFGPYTGHSWRTHGDIAGIGSAATWYALMGNFDSNSAHPGSNGPNHWNDPDYLLAHVPGVSDIEAQSQFSLWALMASPLIIGGDVRTVTPAQLEMLTNREVIAINQDPLGMQAIKVADPGYQLQIWMKVLSAPGERAVALFNRGDAPAPITIVNSELGLSGSFAVRDVWAHADKGRFSSYSAVVPARGAVVLKLTGSIENNRRTAAINAGGTAAGSFAADTNTVDGQTLTSADPIALGAVTDPAPAAVYQSARAGRTGGTPIQYYVGNLTVGGSYRVRLHFAEHWLNGAALRQFNVRINGTQVLSDFDIFAAAGYQAHKAVIQEFTTTASQGFVSIDLSKGAAAEPMISGVEVIATGYVPPTASPSNLARAGTPFASSQWDGNYSAFKATDGNSSATRWNAGAGTSSGGWLEVDLGAPATFDKTVIKEAFNRITYYTTQYFNGSGWVDIIAGRKAGANKVDTFPAITASRVRLFANTTVPDGGGDSPSIWEFEIYNTSSSAPSVPPTSPPVNVIPSGVLEEVRASDRVARGWTFDPDSSTSIVNVQVYVDGPAGVGTLIGSASANLARPDINAAYGITGNHGFELTIPAAYADGVNHAVYAYAADVNASGVTTMLAGSPKVFNVPPSTPSTPPSGPTLSSSAVIIGLDTVTKGSWKGVYGSDGNQIANESLRLPAYATTAFNNYASYTWSGFSSDSRALQKMSAPDRIASVWYSSRFTVGVAITDGQVHPISLYFLDWDNLQRSVTVDVSDAQTGTILVSQNLSSFVGGTYLALNVSGSIVITVTGTNGSQAVLSGLFFGGTAPTTPPTDPTTPDPGGPPPSGSGPVGFVKTDASTQGNWKGVYGTQGYQLAADRVQLPPYASVSFAGKSDYTWNPDTSQSRALQYSNYNNRLAATWYSATSFSVRVTLTDGLPHQIALYLLDWDNLGRAETIRVTDGTTGALLDTRSASSFGNGKYYVWTLTGSVSFEIVRDAGPNAVLSAVFIDP